MAENPYVLPHALSPGAPRWAGRTPPLAYGAVLALFLVAALPLGIGLAQRPVSHAGHEPAFGGDSWLVSLNVGADLLTGLAYVAISAYLIILARRAGRAIPFLWAFVAFGAFIVACGLTHLAAVLAIWTPAWQLTGAIKYATAAASVATAVALPPLVPRVVALAAEARSAEERRRQLVSANRERDEAEARFRGAFGDAPIGMALVGPEGGFLHVNNALCELVGYDQAD
ncbi:MAG: PAS domain S-box protein, partial [Chloroflexota bacterium]|nr:PAS domain S-box protein [Chloroflexota bacterium]